MKWNVGKGLGVIGLRCPNHSLGGIALWRRAVGFTALLWRGDERPPDAGSRSVARRENGARLASGACSRRGRFCSFALAVLAVLATAAPEQAAAQTVTTFISNAGQTATASTNAIRATAFTTGTGTYTLSSVGIRVTTQGFGTNPTPLVQIYGDTGGNPGTLVATMTSPGTITDNALNIYTAPANTTLSASTTYWVVTSNSRNSGGTGFEVPRTTSTSLDSGTAAGWSLGNARWRNDHTLPWSTSTYRILFQIRGTEGTAPNNPPMVANAIPDQTATAGTGFSYIFPANTFNDTDTGQTLSYMATTLPTWLGFTAGTRTFAGTPQVADIGTVSVKVTASDGNGGSVSDEFDITVVSDPNAGICARTEAVRDALLAEIAGVTDCALVTDTHLAAITGTLDLDREDITVLAAGDFDGLTALTQLDLESNELTALPAGVFDELTALVRSCDLYNNSLTALPAGVFDELTALTQLDLDRNELTALPAGVFDGLTALTRLDLGDNSLTALPAGVFDGLTALTRLELQDNSLTALPAGVFDELTALTQLDLDDNSLTALPAGVFDGLTALTRLKLGGNSLTALPAGVFDELTALTRLNLDYNSLTELPDDVFELLTSLSYLDLRSNPGAPFSPTAVALPDDGTVPAAGGTVMLDGSGSGGAWGTNVTYAWALTTPTTGVTVTFDNDASAKPTVTIPQVTAGTDLVFTLTVTGRGGSRGISTSTDTAAVTVNATEPGAPTDLTATASGSTTIDLIWKAPASDGGAAITGYKIEVSPNGTSNWTNRVANTTSTDTTYAHTGLAGGTTRHYRVSAINSVGTGTTSNVDSATTTAPTNNAPTTTGGTATTPEDTPYTFAAVDFNFSDADSGDTLASVIITAGPTAGSLTVDGVAITSADRPKTVSKADIDAGKLKLVPPANATGPSRFNFKVNDGTDDSAEAEFRVIMNAVNDPPTVANAIPDQTATAGTAFSYQFPTNTFNDVDTGATLSYEATKADGTMLPTWLGFTDGTRTFAGTPVAAATGTVSVKVTASDGNGGSVSNEFDIAVNAAANTPATGAPTITGTPQVGQTLTAATTTIMDANGLNNVSYTYQWIRVDGGTETNISLATSSTYTLVGDDQGKTIKVKVSFTDDANNAETLTSVATAVVSAVATAPGAPRSLSATASGTNRINLSWSAPASDGGSAITGYRIEVSPNGNSNWTDRVANTTGTNTSYAHTGLATGTTRHYRVSAINANGTGTPSNVDDATTGTTGSTVPGAPTRLTATASGSTRIDLSWSAPASNGGSAITGYRIEVSSDGGSSWSVRVANTRNANTRYAHTGFAAGTTRHYRVSAINANGTGATSNVGNATTGSGPIARPPGAPRSLAATAGDGEVFLEWTAPADDGGSPVTGYLYRYAAGDGVPGNTTWQFAGLTLERTVTGLTNGQPYAFEVLAVNSVGPGAVARAVATPLGGPSVPKPLTATAGDGEVFLEWTAPADDGGTPVTGYEYRYAAGAAVPERTQWQSAELNLEWTVTGLTNGRQYVFEVRARNRVGPGAPAKAVATPVGVPGAPASLTATAGDGEVVLAWSAPVGDGGTPVAGYEYRYAAGTAVPEHAHWRSAGRTLKWTVSGLTNGQQYAFEVRARNRVGEGKARGATATPVGAPGVPLIMRATAGDKEVALAWRAPLDDGGTPVTGYEYRYAAGAAVPEGTPWQSAGLNLEWTVTGLTNGQQYAFEVRARNRVGDGEPRRYLATPLGRPGSPASLRATAGDKEVALAWRAPPDDGGTPVTSYEYRHATGGAVPEGTPWRYAGLDLARTVTGLTNGQQYAFEVRARNRVGEGEPRGALATPLGRPGAPASLTATADDGEVGLAWSAPADDGGTPVTGYEYRFGAGDAVPGETPWREASAEGTATVTGLENETRYAFEVRALNRVGPGEASRTTALPLRLRAELFSSGAAAEGEALVVGVRRSGGLAFEAHAYIGVTDNALPGVSATEEGRGDGLGRHRLEFAAGEAEATVTVTIAFDGERRQDRALTATLDSAATAVDGVIRAYEPAAPTLVVAVTEGDAGLSVADARVQGKSAVLAFTVSMDRTRDVAVRVDYATEDGSARAGEDYTPVAGTLTIQPGGREGMVEVPVLPALHVTGERTLTLTLSNAGNAVIEDGMATGTIARTSELPKAWLARFGRTASDHVAQAIGRRLAAGERETHVTVAGRRMDGLFGRLRSGGGGLLASTARNMAGSARSGLAAAAARSADPDGPGESAETLRRAVLPDFGFRLPEVQDALVGSSFYVQGGALQAEGGGGTWAAWGDVATTHFEADASGLGLNGDVTTGTVGLDRRWRKLLVGLALARSGGEGAYGAGAGTITSTLSSVHPYLSYRLAERAQLWGAMGWGRGGMLLTPGRGAAIETDLSNSMAALGGRAVLRRAGATGSSLEIALRSDLLWTSTSSDRAGVLAEATGSASRGRLMLEGAGRISGLGGVLRPSVEGGLRYDGGDAETGAGLEAGGGLDWARGGLALRVNGRMLLAYADDSYEEWGYGGSLVYEPGAADGRGLRMRLGFGAGATASGVQGLWALENARGLVRHGGMPFARRSDAEVGFGLGGALLWYPYLAADATGQKRFGLRLNSGRSLNVGLEFGRRSDGTQPAKDALVLRGDIRF